MKIKQKVSSEKIEQWKSMQEPGDILNLSALLGVKSRSTVIRYLKGYCTFKQIKIIDRYMNKKFKNI